MIEESRATKLNSISCILLTVLVCECVTGSSGRWLEFGSLSVRMVIFIVAAVTAIPFVIQNISSLIKNNAIRSVLILCLFIGFSTIYGYIKGNNTGYVVADLTSFLFLFIIPYYIVVFNTQRRVERLIKYASYASVALGVVTIIFHFVLLFLSRETEEEINHVINYMGMGGFFGFGDGIYRIYFKSSVCLILPFLYNLNLLIKNRGENKRPVWPYVFMSISLIAIVLTYTRSVWLGMIIAVVVFLIINHTKLEVLVKGISIAVAGFLAFAIISWACYGFEGVITNAVKRVLLVQENQEIALKEELEGMDEEAVSVWLQIESDDIRVERLRVVYAQIKDNWVLGSGFGQELSVRNYGGKIEYTYLDILNKMGIFGFMSFLLVLLMPFFLAYRKYRSGTYNSLVGVMLCAMAGIYAASIFNPFITSPIGFSLLAVTIALICVAQTAPINAKD